MVSREQRIRISRRILGAVFTFAMIAAPSFAQEGGKKFYADDPLLREPPPRPVAKAAKQDVDNLYDFLENSFVTPRKEGKVSRGPHPALDVNTLGEVPDSPWYTSRHYYHRLSIEELKRGPGNSTPPSPQGSWRVTSAKSDGVTPGFVIEDGQKNKYLLKFDPADYPEVASAVDVIGSKVFYALGYYTPENYIVHFHREQLEIPAGVMWRDADGKKHPLTERVIDAMLKTQPKGADGAYRVIASRWIAGQVLGPFRYEGTRTDDPNDIVAHEDRRELRGLEVFAAWLNHTDTKSINTIDSLVSENGVQYIKHHLLDFGSIMGSGGTGVKRPWFGHEYVLEDKEAPVQALTLGLHPPRWARSSYPKLTGAGLFDYQSYDPMAWKPDYPNPAFLLRDDQDAFWAAKQIAAFTDAEIRALVETGEYSDPRTTDWIAKCLIERRNKTVQAWFSRVLPLDKFRVMDGSLTFEDVSARSELAKGREYPVRWASWDRNGHVTPLADAGGRRVPGFRDDTQYLAATIGCTEAEARCKNSITVYLRHGQTGPEVVGVDR
jgi:hypothetical protein